MAREKKVIDASVVVKWFLTEKNSKEALMLREEHLSGSAELIVPELVFLEVLNALRYKGHDEKALAEANKALWDIQFHVVPLNLSLNQKIIQLSLKHDITIYDAAYVAIAQLHGAHLITADEALAKIPNVILL